jgi:hypothetical protein
LVRRDGDVPQDAKGEFSYKTSSNSAKTRYRVVYDGFLAPFGPQFANHLSTVSAVKTAWPR